MGESLVANELIAAAMIVMFLLGFISRGRFRG